MTLLNQINVTAKRQQWPNNDEDKQRKQEQQQQEQ